MSFLELSLYKVVLECLSVEMPYAWNQLSMTQLSTLKHSEQFEKTNGFHKRQKKIIKKIHRLNKSRNKMSAFVVILKSEKLISVRDTWVQNQIIGEYSLIFYSPNDEDEPNFELKPSHYHQNIISCYEARVLKQFGKYFILIKIEIQIKKNQNEIFHI